MPDLKFILDKAKPFAGSDFAKASGADSDPTEQNIADFEVAHSEYEKAETPAAKLRAFKALMALIED